MKSRKTAAATETSGWRVYRREIAFLVAFVLILGLGFTLLAWNPVNDHVIVPFTAGIARASGITLALLGQNVRMNGTYIANDRFAVNIENGCNGVEAMIIFLAAVLAFPASWGARGIGLALGLVAIQAVNLLRVVALFLTGVYFREWFDSSHTVVWQTVVIGFALLLWLYWAGRWAAPAQAPARAAE